VTDAKADKIPTIWLFTYKEESNVQKRGGQLLWSHNLTFWIKADFILVNINTRNTYHVSCAMCHVRFEHKNLMSERPAHWTMGNGALCSPLCSPLLTLLIFVIEVFYFSVSASHQYVLCDELHWLTDWTLCANTVFWQQLEDFDSVIRNTLLSSR